MSEIEIPKEYSLAKAHIETLHKQGHPKGEPCEIAACIVINALVWALAGWMRSEFYHIHAQHEFNCRVFECHTKADPRHTWTEEQWLAAAWARLEER